MDGQVGRPVPREHADPAGAEVEGVMMPADHVRRGGVCVGGALENAVVAFRYHRNPRD